MVVVDPRGGLQGRGGRRSFVSGGTLARLCGPAASAATGWTRGELRELLAGVRGGIESINLTTAEGLQSELLSYEGDGTLVTDHRYCTVGVLGIEHYREAHRLLERGERDGFLLKRSEEEKTRLLVTGYGAWFGATHLSGVASLEIASYRRARVGEVAGLYTITRFQGEGVGVRIIEHLVQVGRSRGLRALFACTSSPRAASFFDRNGFTEVAPSRVPDVKWKGRRGSARPVVLWRDLA